MPTVELDPGVAPYVEALRAAGIETFESCEGGPGHAVSEPTVWFNGERAEGFRALAVCIENKLPAFELRRTWTITDGEPSGPIWELAFSRKAAYRNLNGDPIRVEQPNIRVLDDSDAPSIRDLIGLVPDLTDGMTPEEYVRRLRNG